jgi:hypothetical protein
MDIDQVQAKLDAALEERRQIEIQANYKLGQLEGRIEAFRECLALSAVEREEGGRPPAPPPS